MANEGPPLLTDECMRPYILNHSDLKFETVIGAGAAGEVSVGIHIPTNRTVSIKKLYDIDINTNDLSFRREVHSLVILKHPFVLPFIGFTNSAPYCIVTKFIPCGSLYHALRNTNPTEAKIEKELNPTDLTLIAYGVALGMKYIHEEFNLIHRDLKTQNILLDEKNLPVICDFGSTRVLDKVMTGQCGTPNYMAPEFIRNESYDQSVDVYSYGMVLWEMITKEAPYSGKAPAQVIYMILAGRGIDIPDGTPDGLKSLIEACCSTNVTKRPHFDTIVKLFENGHCLFPGCNFKDFLDNVALYPEFNKSRRNRPASKSSSYNGQLAILPPIIRERPIKNHNHNKNFLSHHYNNNILNSNLTGNSKKNNNNSIAAASSLNNINDTIDDNNNFEINNFDNDNDNDNNNNSSSNSNGNKNNIDDTNTNITDILNNNLNNKAKNRNNTNLNVSHNKRSTHHKRADSIGNNKYSMSIRTHIAQLANAYIGGISTGTDQQIRVSIDFFIQHSADPMMVQIEIWPKFLPVLVRAKPSLLPEFQKMAIRLAQSQEVLLSIANVSDLHRFLRPETFDLFLYVINFVPKTISYQMVQNLFQYALKGEEIGEKAIKLLCKILNVLPKITTAEQCTIEILNEETELILKFFVQNAAHFAENEGGHLVLRTLLTKDLTTKEMLSSFAESSLKDNVIASYECFFSYSSMPNLFTLPQILTHMTAEDSRIRACAMEFVLRFGQNAVGPALLNMLDALFVTVLKYGSEQAILLLSRIAEDHDQSSSLLNPRIAELWLQISPAKAPSLLRIFVILFLDSRHRKNLTTMRDSASFLANVLRTGDSQSLLTVCWMIPQMDDMNSAYAQFLEETDFNELIAEKLKAASKHKNNSASHTKLIKMIANVISVVSKFLCSGSFRKDVKTLMKLIHRKNEAAPECLSTLSHLSYHQDTHDAFIEENAIGVLMKYKGEGTKQIKLIMNNLKASGKLSIP